LSLDRFLIRWQGEAFRHLPDVATVNFFDFSRAGQGAGNRWNDQGQPTLYLAGDLAIAMGEWTRHMQVDRGLPATSVRPRRVYQVAVSLDAVLDLRDPAVWQTIALDDAPTCFLDPGKAQATARYIRTMTTAQGLLVPSIVFLDDLTRWNLVLFLDRLPAPPAWLRIVDQSRLLQVP
jgi:RES domain-containing protein